MVFARLYDLPQKFLDEKVQGAGYEQNYPDGIELVWEVEADIFRVFKWKSAENTPQEFTIDEDLFS